MALTKVGGGIIQQPIDVGIITATSVNASGVITATSFDGNVTGDVTGNLTGTASTASASSTAYSLTGSPNITIGSVTATTGNFSGNLDVGGVLTYEDVTNVDAVGIVTARIGVKASNIQIGVTGGTEIDTTSGNLTLDSAGGTTTVDDYLTVTGGGNVSAGDWRFTGASNKHVTWDNSEGALEWADNAKATFGDGIDLQIHHDGSNTWIDNTEGDLYLRTIGSGDDIIIRAKDDVLIQTQSSEGAIIARGDGQVELYYNNDKKFETTTTGATVTGTLVSDLDLTAIDSTISDTAVDVFIYDTSKDSDGGAWRKRTQHTSWYNETLNTATRGGRKEFPAVAVLVLEAGKLTIYDGDDPDLPMWMVFNNTGSNVGIFGRSLSTKTSVEMLNGLLVIGGSYSSAHFEAFTHINFISEKCQQTDNTGTVVFHKNISQRGETSTYYSDTSSFTIVNIVSVNDVAMTVLPNAPIDDATGLPVPTIAVATNGGISVIKDDGTVSSKTITGGIANHYIDFLDNGNIVVEQGYQYTTVLLDYTAESQAYTSSLSNSEQYTHLNSGWEELRFPYLAVGGSGVSGNYKLTSFKNNFASAHSGGLVLVDRNALSPSNGLIAGITTSYNTGWMHGDIKGAFLSDTDTTNVTGGGDGLITGNDSTFGDTIANLNWSERSGSGGAWNVSGGVLKTGTVSSGEYLDITTSGYTSGQTYVISYTLSNVTGSMPLRWRFNNGQMGNLPTSNGSHSYYVTLTETGTLFSLLNDNNLTADIDNFKLQLVQEEDRSVNNKGLQVYGTVTKSAVATGAELVGYSGFSASNYLQQPYNSDLDFGTGDLSIMFWFKTPSGSVPTECLLHRGDGGTGTWGSGKIIQIEFNSTNLAAFLAESAFSSYDTVAIPGAQATSGQWMHYTLVRRGTFVGAYLNGELKASTSSSRNLSNTSAKTWIGERPNSSRPATTSSLALFRMGASAPSDEQIKKIYNNEKHLYRENSKATLYGSSDAVTALGYDEDTELLHVGTSAGRSDFQGLRRINNTTTAVTTAISASDDLIAEQ